MIYKCLYIISPVSIKIFKELQKREFFFCGVIMKRITNLMISQYNLKKIDFMGYIFTRDNASYHHLIIPRRLGGPETVQNGAILNGKTSHPYLHIIEYKDLDIFNLITSEMIDMNIKGFLDSSNLRKINDLLTCFEREHSGDSTKKGKVLIKEEYTRRFYK